MKQTEGPLVIGRVVWGILGRAAEKGLSEELVFEQRLEWHDMQNLMEKVPGRGLSKYKDPDRRKSLSWNSDARAA